MDLSNLTVDSIFLIGTIIWRNKLIDLKSKKLQSLQKTEPLQLFLQNSKERNLVNKTYELKKIHDLLKTPEQKAAHAAGGAINLDDLKSIFRFRFFRKKKIIPINSLQRPETTPTPIIAWTEESIEKINRFTDSVIDQIRQNERTTSANENLTREHKKEKDWKQLQEVFKSQKGIDLILSLPEDIRLKIFVQWLKLYNKDDLVAAFSEFYYEDGNWLQASLIDKEYIDIADFIKSELNLEIVGNINKNITTIKEIEFSTILQYISKIFYALQNQILPPQEGDSANNVLLFEKEFRVLDNHINTFSIHFYYTVNYDKNEDEQFHVQLKLKNILETINSEVSSPPLYLRGLNMFDIYEEFYYYYKNDKEWKTFATLCNTVTEVMNSHSMYKVDTCKHFLDDGYKGGAMGKIFVIYEKYCGR